MTDVGRHNKSRSFEITGKHVLVAFCLFFGTILLSNIAMISLAITTFPGLESESAYKAGRNYNQQIAQSHQQDDLGWQVAVDMRNGADGTDALRLRFMDSLGTPLADLKIKAVLRRTVHSFDDIALEFVQADNGVYEASLRRDELAGQWRFKAEATNRSGAIYHLEQKIYVKP